MLDEEWKDIPGWEGFYQASSLGRIKSLSRFVKGRTGLPVLKKELILKISVRSKINSYNVVSLCRDGTIENVSVHRIVAQAFIPNPENKPCVNHKDGNKLNDRLDNLEWVTSSENSIHAYSTGLSKKRFGEKHHNSKLTNEAVLFIREMKGVIFQKDLAKKFNVNKATIGEIQRGEIWTHI